MSIPRLSTPLSKLIRTGEGVILFGFNATGIVLAAVGDVAPGLALKYAAIFNAVAFASRQALKAVAVAKPLVGGDPITPVVAGVTADTALAEIEAVAKATEAFQSKPGTPAPDLTHGLAPSLVPDLVPDQTTTAASSTTLNVPPIVTA